MRKLLTFVFTTILLFGATFVVNAAEGQESSIIVSDNVRDRNLPVEFVKDREIPTYDYEGDDTYDFRKYFNISENRKSVLNMWEENPVDLGGYDWIFGAFNPNRVGTYRISLSYKGITKSIQVRVIEEDTTPPYIFRYDNGEKVEGLPDKIIVEAGKNIASEFIVYFVGDNVDGEKRLVERNNEGEYVFKDEYFPNHDILDEPELETEYLLEVRVSDESGNLYSEDVIIIIKDTTPPIIYNMPNIEVKKGVKVDYKEKLRVSDNYDNPEDLEIIIDIIDKDGNQLGTEEDIEDLFNKLGEHRIRFTVRDTSGNASTRVVRLVVKNSFTIGEIFLYVNLGTLVVASVAIGAYFLTKKRSKKMENEKDE